MQTPVSQPLSQRRIFQTWWPLATSWLFMALELPCMTFALSRLPNPEIQLAAFGGIAFPFAMLIEAPIVMLLTAAVEVVRDAQSYRQVYRFMMRAGFILTCVHLLFALTPLFDRVLAVFIVIPPLLVEPTHTALLILTPWTWSIAYRRYHQGVLIRYGRQRYVGVGTSLRLSGNVLVLAFGLLTDAIPGAALAATAVIVGVVAEAIFIGIVSRKVVREEIQESPAGAPQLSNTQFLFFYLPLALTSLLGFLVQPLGSAAMSRMPLAIESLAVWPVVAGLSFVFRCFGMALNEVTVALARNRESHGPLLRFALSLALGTTAGAALIGFTPLSDVVFQRIFTLPPQLAPLARDAFLLALPLPALTAIQSWFQGIIVTTRRTHFVTLAIVVYLFFAAIFLFSGIRQSSHAGVLVAMGTFSIAHTAMVCFLAGAKWWVLRSTAKRSPNLLVSN